MTTVFFLLGFSVTMSFVSGCYVDKYNTSGIDPITLSLPERLPKDYIVANFSEIDNITLRTQGDKFPPFIEARGGSIYTNDTVDLDNNPALCATKPWIVIVQCASDLFSKELFISIEINPSDDFDPEINGSPSLTLAEMTSVNATVFDLSSLNGNVTDRDCDSGTNRIYGLENSNSSFLVSGSELKVIRLLDFENGDKIFNLNISVITQPNGTHSRKGFTMLNVHVRDVDDMNPAFTAGRYDLFVQEENLTGVGEWKTTSPKIEAHDLDIDINETLEFSLMNSSFGNIIELNRTSGEVKLKTTLDREMNDVIEIPIKVQQVDNALRSASSTLIVHVEDINDNRPLFQTTIYGPVFIAEHSLQHTSAVVVTAIDRDVGGNANFTYTLSGGDMFTIRTDRVGNILIGVITVANSSLLDREIHQQFNLTVSTREINPPEGKVCNDSCNATVMITLTDINDHSPQFPNTSSSLVVKNNTAGAVIFKVTATDADADENAEIEYSIASSTPSGTSCGNFEIIDSTGEIILTSAITQANTVCSALIQACDKPVDRTQRRCTSQFATITLPDDAVLNVTSYTANVYENLPERTIVLQMERNAESFIYNDGKFKLANGLLTTLLALDREEQDVYHLFIQTQNVNNTNITVTVNVLDVNDNAPEFSGLPPVALHNMSQGYPIARVNATDRDEGDNAKVAYRFQPSGDSAYFIINTTTGEITLDTQQGVDQDAFHLVIIAYDGGTPSLTNTATLEVQLPGNNRTIPLSVAVPEDIVRENKDNIQRELSAIFGLQITIENIQPASSSSDSRWSVLRISGRNTSESVSKTELQALANKHFGEIQSIFDRYGQKATPPLENETLSIALIVVTAVLFVALIIALVIIIRKRRSFNRQKHLLLTLNRNSTVYENAPVALEEGVSILDKMEADHVDNGLGAINPAFVDDSSSIGSTSHNYLNTTNVTETELLPNEGSTKVDNERKRENMADADSGVPSDRENGAGDSDSDSDSDDAKKSTGNGSAYLAAVLMSPNSTSPDSSVPADKVNIEKTLPPTDYHGEETQLPEPPVDFLEEQEISLAMQDDDDASSNSHLLPGNAGDDDIQDTPIKLSPLVMFARPPTPPMKHKPKTKEEEEEEAAMPEEPMPDYGKKVRFNFKIIEHHHPDEETDESVHEDVNSFSVSEPNETKENSVSDVADGTDAEPEPYLSPEEEITSL